MKHLSLFLACALVSFTVAAPGIAESARLRTMASTLPFNGLEKIAVPIGTDFPSSSITGAFFDYYLPRTASDYGLAILTKVAYSGASYTDYQRISVTAGAHDEYLVAANVLINASPYDYLYAQAYLGDATGQAWYGIAVTSSL
jgi:hypothetical protein